MGAVHPATAEGDLARTPIGHLLVYALDRRLTGALSFCTPEGVEHVVQLDRGVAVKIRPGDRYALLGEMLIEAGAIDPGTLEGALTTKGLLGDVLVLAGRVDRDVLERVAAEQFRRRMVRLFSLPKEVKYRYWEGQEALGEYGGGPASVDPLALLWAGMRAHGDASTMLAGTLALLGDAAMRLHPLATTARFGLTEAEEKVVVELREAPTPMSRLLAAAYLPEETLRRLCYTLLITRQIELGTGTLPVGANDVTRTPPAGMAVVAKMQLRPTVHRVGAAAPDPPGDGERPTAIRRLAESRLATGLEPARPLPEALERPSPVPARAAPIEPAAPSLEDPRATLKSASGPLSASFFGEDSEKTLDSAGEQGTEVHRRGHGSADGASVVSGVRPAMSVRGRGHASGVSKGGAQVTVLSAPALFQLAIARLCERDFAGALEACAMARKAAPGEADYRALSTWIRAQMPDADLHALALELDDVLTGNEAHIQSRYYRAILRRRLGDELAAISDLRRVIELFPAHPEAARELAILEARRPKERGGIFGRLFKR